MSVLAFPTLSAPLEGSSESNRLLNTPSGTSKCAEIFVTNNADKWTFFCVHCEKATSDIGAFICHIRLEHLNDNHHIDLSGNDQSTKVLSSKVSHSKTNNNSEKSGGPKEIDKGKNSTENDQEPTQRDSSIVTEEQEDLEPNASQVPNMSDVTLLRQPPESEEIQPRLSRNNQMSIRSNVVNMEVAGNQELSKNTDITSLHQPPACEEREDIPALISKDHTTDDQLLMPKDNVSSNVPIISNVTSFRQISANMETENFLVSRGEKLAAVDSTIHCDDVNAEFIIPNEVAELQSPASKVPKISAVTSLRQPSTSKETENLHNKNTSSSISEQVETNLQFFAITSIGQDLQQHVQKEIVQVVYLNNENKNKEQEQNDKDNNENNIQDISHTGDVLMPDEGSDEDVNAGNLKLNRIVRLKLPYKCGKCNKDFKYKGSLEKHALCKHKGVIQCPVCLLKLSKWCFLSHVRMHESETCFPCQVCGKIFESNRDRMKHWKMHAVEKPYACNMCFQRFRKQQYLTGHMKIHPRYQCNLCSTLFTSRKTQTPPHICEMCKEVPENLEVVELDPVVENSDSNEVITNITDLNANGSAALNDNDAISIDNDDEEDSDIEFIDESYADNIPSVSTSNTGQTPKDNDKNSLYKCGYCNREFISARRLICHNSKMHDKNEHHLSRFICRYCNRSFQTRSGLALHHKTHDKSNQFHCPICPLTEFRESSFITHVLMHESATCFPCQVCAKVFTSNTERLQHWQIHIEERPHGCNHCYRRFYQKNVLKNHMKSHGLYYCHYCQNNFQSERTIQPPYVCGGCDKLPYIKNQLKRRSTLKSKKKTNDSEGE